MTTETIKTKANRTFDISKYAREILGVKKNTLKFSISDQEELSDLMEVLFEQRLTNTNDNVQVGFNNSSRYNSLLQVKAYGKVYFIYSQVSESKLKTNLGK